MDQAEPHLADVLPMLKAAPEPVLMRWWGQLRRMDWPAEFPPLRDRLTFPHRAGTDAMNWIAIRAGVDRLFERWAETDRPRE